MSEMLDQFHTLLVDVILPHLKDIQASQAEQRAETDRLQASLDKFRAEMTLRFADLHAELAACRLQIEDTMVTLAETEAANEAAEIPPSGMRLKKNLLN